MTAKEYLSQAYYVDKRIQSKLIQVESLRDLANKVTPTSGTEHVSGSRSVHRMEETIDTIIDLENDINAEVDRLIDLKREIMANINKVHNHNYMTLLELRYLSFMSWDKVAKEMNFTSRWIHILHSKALLAMDKILTEEGK